MKTIRVSVQGWAWRRGAYLSEESEELEEDEDKEDDRDDPPGRQRSKLKGNELV